MKPTSTLDTEMCTTDNACNQLFAFPTCCNKGVGYSDGGDGSCLTTEMKDPRPRSRILEFAKHDEIWVPNCNGAYVPARVAFRLGKGRDNGGM